MSAGYVIYSLDASAFQQLVEHPTQQQLEVLGRELKDILQEHESDPNLSDPVLSCARDAEALSQLVARRLPLADWYGDLSFQGKGVWENLIWRACTDCDGIDVGFRCDDEGVYWHVLELAWKQLGIVPGQVSDVALSAFGHRPYRYFPRIDKPLTRKEHDKKYGRPRTKLGRFLIMAKFVKRMYFGSKGSDGPAIWSPMHSMHTPEEVRKMLAELHSIEPAMRDPKEAQKILTEVWSFRSVTAEDVLEMFDQSLLPSIERVANENRMLFIQVDT